MDHNHDERAQMFQSFLSDQCWRCRREPACAKMVILQDYGESVGIVETESGYECQEYARDLPDAHL